MAVEIAVDVRFVISGIFLDIVIGKFNEINVKVEI